MRSSFVGIWNKKVVCVGYANLLTAFLIKLGLDARPVLCGVGDKRAVAKGETDHMITKVKTKLGDYYCDATTRSFNYFMLTKKELQEKNIFLIVAESPSYRTQSIREEITKLLNEKDKDTYRKGVIKAVNKIRKLVNSCFGIKDFEKLSTEQKENAKKIAEDMEKEKVFAK